MFLKNRLLNKASIICGLTLIIIGFVSCLKDTDNEQKILTLTSWRTDDVEQMNRINAMFTELHPNIKINFLPVNATEYDVQTRNSLQIGTGADILFLRSYDKGRVLYDKGFLYNLTDIIPNLISYSPVPVKAWSTDEGITYGVPSVGVTHGIYYQKSIFEKHNIQEPVTWDEFIEVCETLLNAGETVIAQGIQDNWTLYEVVFSGLGANFYGGERAREALIKGELKCTDDKFVEAFRAVNSLKKYFPNNFETLDYPEMQKLFGTGQAALYIGGSWEISVFEDLGSDHTKIGWFAPPVLESSDQLQYCFHVDAGIGINKNSKNIEAAIEYIKWVSGSEYAQSIMDELPGLFSYTPASILLSNPLAQQMLDATENAALTVRPMCEKLSAQDPSAYNLMGTALKEMILGNYKPETAAAYVQEQLDTWYKPH